MQDQGEVERRDGAERGSSRISDGVKRKFPAVAAILLAGTIMLGAAAGWQFARPVPAGPPTIEMIPSADVAEAMKTLSAEAIQQAKSAPRQCRVQFGHITVATPGNAAGGTVRFRIGAYVSPPFVVTDKPQQIAIPNPFPETGGTGFLSVDGEVQLGGRNLALEPSDSSQRFGTRLGAPLSGAAFASLAGGAVAALLATSALRSLLSFSCSCRRAIWAWRRP